MYNLKPKFLKFLQNFNHVTYTVTVICGAASLILLKDEILTGPALFIPICTLLGIVGLIITLFSKYNPNQ
jgi:hypothetical protein